MGPRAVARMMAAVVALSMSRTRRDLRCSSMVVLPVRLWCTREIPGAMGLPYGKDPSVTALRDTGALCATTHPHDGRHTCVKHVGSPALEVKRFPVLAGRGDN